MYYYYHTHMSSSTAPTSLLLIGTVQPHMPGCDGPSEAVLFHTREEKRAFADALAGRELAEVPLCLDHAGMEREPAPAPGEPLRHVVVPTKARIGRYVNAWVDKGGNLMAAAELYWDAPETREVIASMRRGEHWGFSLGVDAIREPGIARNKSVNHLGLTRAPAYGDDVPAGTQTTWVHEASLSPNGIVNALAPYLQEEGAYIPDAMRRTYEPLLAAAQPPAFALPVGASHEVSEANKSNMAMGDAPALAAQFVSVGASRFEMAEQSTTTPSTPATLGEVAAAPAQNLALVMRELDQMHSVVQQRFTAMPEQLDYKDYVEAQELKKRYSDVLSRAGMGNNLADLPASVAARIGELGRYIEFCNDHVKAGLDQIYKGDLAADKQATLEMLSEPLKYRPMLGTIIAVGNTKLQGFRAEQQKLEEERRLIAEKAAAEQRAKAEAEVNERDAVSKKRIAELEQRIADQERDTKRARVDAPGAATQGAGTPVSVGASRMSQGVAFSSAIQSGMKHMFFQPKQETAHVLKDMEEMSRRYAKNPPAGFLFWGEKADVLTGRLND